MTKQEAKHFSEVLKAYSESKPIQGRNLTSAGYSDWRDIAYINLYDATIEYRVKPEPRIRAYETVSEFLKDSKEHGPYIVSGNNNVATLLTECELSNGKVVLYHDEDNSISSQYLLDNWKWQDGSPCGIKE